MRKRTTLAAAVILTTGTTINLSATLTMAQEKKPEPVANAVAPFTPAQLIEHNLHRSAVQAVIWGMPAVNFDRMLQAAIANGAAGQLERSDPDAQPRHDLLQPVLRHDERAGGT